MQEKWIVFEKEQVVEGFKKFVERVVEDYDGSYYLSIERLIENYARSLSDEHGGGRPMVLQGKGNSVESLESFLVKAFKEKEKKSWFNEVMSKHMDEEKVMKMLSWFNELIIDEEKVRKIKSWFNEVVLKDEKKLRKIIRGQLESPKHWLSPEYDLATAIAINEKLEKLEEDFIYYLPWEVSNELKEVFSYVKWSEKCEFFDRIFEDLVVLEEDLKKKHNKEAYLGMEYYHWRISLTFPREEILSGYVYDKEKVVSGLLEYMKENGDLLHILDLENYKKARKNLMQKLYIRALSNPGIRKFIQEFTESVLLYLRDLKEKLKQREEEVEESLAP